MLPVPLHSLLLSTKYNHYGWHGDYIWVSGTIGDAA